MLDNVFWNVFLNTGDLNCYLAYRNLVEESEYIIGDENDIQLREE